MAMKLQLKAYALLESMFAMVVIMICFGIAMMTFSNIIHSTRASLETLARVRTQTEAERCKEQHELLDDIISYEEFHIERTITPSTHAENLYELKLEAITPDGHTLYEYHELIAR